MDAETSKESTGNKHKGDPKYAWQGLAVKAEGIPAELKGIAQWVCWMAQRKDDGSMSKIPVMPSGRSASTTDADTHSTFVAALDAYKSDSKGKRARKLSGIGFVFTEDDDLVMADFDHCRDVKTGGIDDDVLHAVAELNTYAEISPSGTGIRVIGRGSLGRSTGFKSDRIEMYEHGRYGTVTGRALEGHAAIREVSTELLAKLRGQFGGKSNGHDKARTDSQGAGAPGYESIELPARRPDAISAADIEAAAERDKTGLNDPMLSELWNHQRPYGDDLSKYDLGFASHLLKQPRISAMPRLEAHGVIWSVIIAHRLKYGDADKAHRRDYIQRTILKAYDDGGQERPASGEKQSQNRNFSSTYGTKKTYGTDYTVWCEQLPLIAKIVEPMPFPVRSLGVLGDAVTAVTQYTGAPLAITAQSYLSVAALVAQPHINVIMDGRVTPVSTWHISIGNSGERKTTVDKIVLDVVRKYQKGLIEEYQETINKWRAKRDVLKGKKKKSEHDFLKYHQHLARRPPYPKILTTEPTYEGLTKMLHTGLPNVGLFSDEGGRFVGGYAMSDDHRMKTASGLTSMWDGSPIDRTRSSDEDEIYTLYDRRVAMHLMIQPVVASELIGSGLLKDQGFLPRCLLVRPESTIGGRDYRKGDVNLSAPVAEIRKQFNTILQLGQPQNNGTPVRSNVPYSAEAYERAIEIYGHYERGAVKEYAAVQAFSCKCLEHVHRFAGTLAFIANPQMDEISLEHIESGAAVMQFYMHEALRLDQIAAEDQELNLAQLVLDFMREHGSPVEKARLMQFGPNKARRKAVLDRMLHLLHEHGQVRKMPDLRPEQWELR